MMPLDPDEILVFEPSVQIVEIEGELVGLSQGGLFGLDIDPAPLRAVLRLIDGRRTVAEVVSALAKEYDRDDLTALLDSLHPVVLRRKAPASGPQPVAEARVVVIGSGALATAIRRELIEAGLGSVTSLDIGRVEGDDASAALRRARDAHVCRQEQIAPLAESGAAVPFDGLVARLEGEALVVCAIEGTLGQVILDVNAACLAAKTTALFVTVEGDACVIGPSLSPGRSACFACSRLATTLRSHFHSLGPATLPLLRFDELAGDAPRWLIERVAFEVSAEVRRLLGGGPSYPSRFGSLLKMAPTGIVETLEIGRVSTCPACRGNHRGALLDERATPPEKSLQRIDEPIRDRTGGVRTVGPDEAEARARRALEAMGVALALEPLPDSAPESLAKLGCPYFEAKHTVRFSAQAPLAFTRLRSSCFGKGATESQARCSAVFEWIERNLAVWHGGVDVVRAPYDAVRDRAIDLPFLVSGMLPGLTLDGALPFDPAEPIDWVWGHCLRRDRSLLLPAASLYLDGSVFLGSQLELPRRGSSGLSAGCSVADATLQALLEVVERDATFTAIRCGLVCPEIDLTSVDDPPSKRLLKQAIAAGYVPHLRDITSSIGIPTIEVYFVRDDEYAYHFAPGYGAHFDPVIALRRAVTEAAQSLFSDASTSANDPLRALASRFEVFPHRMQVLTRKAGAKNLADLRVPAPEGVWSQVDEVVSRIGAAIPRADVCMIDLSPPWVEGVHVVRVVVSGTLDEVRRVQVHVPERCRAVALEEMYLGPIDQ